MSIEINRDILETRDIFEVRDILETRDTFEVRDIFATRDIHLVEVRDILDARDLFEARDKFDILKAYIMGKNVPFGAFIGPTIFHGKWQHPIFWEQIPKCILRLYQLSPPTPSEK